MTDYSPISVIPKAHEDDAEQAARAGLKLVEAVGQFAAERSTVSMQVRVGIATGTVVIGDLYGGLGSNQEQGVVGETPNLCRAPSDGVATPGTVVKCAEHATIGRGAIRIPLNLPPAAPRAGGQPVRAWRIKVRAVSGKPL